MITAFLRIRMLQLRRELAALGWWRVAVVAVVTAGVLRVFYGWTHRSQGSWHAAAGVALVVAAIHFARKDRRFLQLATASPFLVTWAEYVCFTAPFIVTGLFSPGWPYAAALPFFYLLLGAAPVTGRRLTARRWRLFFLSPRNFEWRAGIRANLWPLAALYAACLACLPYPYVSLYLWWILVALVIPFYQDAEPRQMLQAWEEPPRRFLRSKLGLQLKDYAIFSAPLMAGYMVFHPSGAWIAAAVWVLSAVNISWFVLAKYAAYEPVTRTGAGQLLMTLVHLAMLIPLAGPFMIPVPLVLALVAYRKSLRRLNPYLDAYH
jgi:hypothetical protein